MALVKDSYPILEYDTAQRAVIMPNRQYEYHFPKKAVFPFLGDEVEKYALANHCEKIGVFESITKIYPIYKTIHNGHEVCLCQAPAGCAAAVQILDYLIGYGVSEVISAGSCGALHDFAENEWLVPTEALRDEGTSYHYLPPGRTVAINETAVAAIKQALRQSNRKYELCKTWTTDGFFRETAEMVTYRKSEGCSVVEMECAGLAACAAFRGAVFGQILFTADTLASAEAHDNRDWGKASLATALELALNAVCKI